MKNFYSSKDIDDLQTITNRILELKNDQFKAQEIGKTKTLLLLFFNPSLRTRLSTQRAAMNLGMNVISLDVGATWNLEIEEGVVMNLDKPEHIKDAAKVMSQYADIIAVRAFPGLIDRDKDYKDHILKAFMKYAEVPVINLESSIFHPLQSLTDWTTIQEFSGGDKKKVVLSWAPHPKALPQAVVNSFLEFSNMTDHDVVITHPPGYELNEIFTDGITVEYDQHKALEGADYVYAKNWSSYRNYGKVISQCQSWRIDPKKMSSTNNAKFMHCLPIRRNVVATDEVLDNGQSLIYCQAKNRMFAAQSVLEKLLTS